MQKATLAKLSLQDKIALCSGKNFWKTKKYTKYGIPELFMCDGPHGLRKQEKATDMLGVNKSRRATCFPSEVTTASSWDVDLLERIGEAIAKEARNQKVGLVLGPGANIKRNPLCGRNFEYFSEDPYLAGKLAAAFISGVEKNGVGTSLKHFACNSQELDRLTSDSVIDERTLREIYLTAFEIAVKEGKPSTIMCAYPKLNGIHCSDNKELLTDILRKEWGYRGTVITDWGAMNDRLAGFRAGCDLNMPGGSAYMEKEVLHAVRSGKLSERYINASASRVLKLVECGTKAMTGETCDYKAHHRLSCQAAIAGAVLLKNEDNILPLNKTAKIAVIGHMAKQMRYQGAGSSHINATKLVQPLDVLGTVTYAQGCDSQGATTDELLAQVEKVASAAEISVVFAGLPDSYESEGFDRENMRMPAGQIKMIEAAYKANPNTVVVMFGGSCIECAWADSVKGILYMGLPGQAGGRAVRKLLYGEAVPSGKLSESWPIRYEDVPSSEIYGKTKDALYEEGLYVGYRYYDKARVAVRWPFGYGLSYTEFAYSKLVIDGNKVSVTVTNMGNYDGAEVVQMYICAPQTGVHRPVRELKSFKKIFLKKGESRQISFTLNDRAFAIWDKGWKIPAGTYEVAIGELRAVVEKKGVNIAVPEWQNNSFYDKCVGKPDFKQWQKLLGREYAPPIAHKKGEYTMEDTILDMSKTSALMNIMSKAIVAFLTKRNGKTNSNDAELRMLIRALVGSPLRSMYISSGVKGGLFLGLLDIANGTFIRGIIRRWRND